MGKNWKNFKKGFQIFLSISVLSAEQCPTDIAGVEIFPCNQLSEKFDTQNPNFEIGVQQLISYGFTKCALPFGIIMAGDQELSDSGILAAAKIAAELIDQNKDGIWESVIFQWLLPSGRHF